jgi:nitrate/TMAO reductase-like tetraheme cytochrome c subunit
MVAGVRSLWRTFRGKLLILGLSAVFLFAGASLVAAKSTESNSFCGHACHEMVPYERTWQASMHDAVSCVRCHIPPGAWSFVKTKLFALREVYVHVMGQVKAPIVVTRQIPDAVCAGCHPSARLSRPVQLVSTTFSHPSHAGVGGCVDCHAQVVHHPIAGQKYIPVRSMTSCFSCHNRGGEPAACTYCHTAPHPDRGPCQDCHGMKSWAPGDFHHPVPLTGPHAQALCEQCHTTSTGSSFGFPDGCVDCHGNHHGDPKLALCAKCHTTTRFVPSTFVHKQVGPHVPAGEERLPCDACHQKSFATATCSCHGGNPPTGG